MRKYPIETGRDEKTPLEVRRTVGKKEDKYIPAFGFRWLTRFYDPFIRWTMPEAALKRQLVEQARIRPGHRVLDLGCGTATLTILIKQLHPGAEVAGLDGDQKILEIAMAKVARAGLDIALEQGMSFALPYPDSSFDRALSSMVFHHLTGENKARTLQEVFRVLRPGGELHVADFGKPHNALMGLISLIMRRLETASDNIKGLLPGMVRRAGFEEVEEAARRMTIFGTVCLYRARRPLSLP